MQRGERKTQVGEVNQLGIELRNNGAWKFY